MNRRFYPTVLLTCVLVCVPSLSGCKSSPRNPLSAAKLIKKKMAAYGYECLVDKVCETGGSLYFLPKMPVGEYPQPGSGRRYSIKEDGAVFALE
jgi:hypothetical protein